MSYAEIKNHDGIKQTPWLKLENGDEICYLVSFEPKEMRFVLVTGHGYEFEREQMKEAELQKILNEMQVWKA